jgi:hypothetical protein
LSSLSEIHGAGPGVLWDLPPSVFFLPPIMRGNSGKRFRVLSFSDLCCFWSFGQNIKSTKVKESSSLLALTGIRHPGSLLWLSKAAYALAPWTSLTCSKEKMIILSENREHNSKNSQMGRISGAKGSPVLIYRGWCSHSIWWLVRC